MSIAQSRTVRIAATRNCWNMLEAFCLVSVRFKFKCNLANASVHDALLSGLTALCEDKRHLLFVRAGWHREPEQAREATPCCDAKEQTQHGHEADKKRSVLREEVVKKKGMVPTEIKLRYKQICMGAKDRAFRSNLWGRAHGNDISAWTDGHGVSVGQTVQGQHQVVHEFK